MTTTNSLRAFVSIMVVAGLALGGCASTPKTFANADPAADFAAYKTFGFIEDPSTNKENYESLTTNFLKVAVAQEMDKRGFAHSDSPDLLINFHINTEEKIRSRSVPTGGGYYGYRDPYYGGWGGYGGGGYETQIDQYTEGTLNIDVVDGKTKKLVWEGAVVGKITDEVLKNLEQSIDEAVAEVMNNFPILPGGGLAADQESASTG